MTDRKPLIIGAVVVAVIVGLAIFLITQVSQPALPPSKTPPAAPVTPPRTTPPASAPVSTPLRTPPAATTPPGTTPPALTPPSAVAAKCGDFCRTISDCPLGNTCSTTGQCVLTQCSASPGSCQASGCSLNPNVAGVPPARVTATPGASIPPAAIAGGNIPTSSPISGGELPSTALISDDADRLLLGLLVIAGGLFVYLTNGHIKLFYALGGRYITAEFSDAEKQQLELEISETTQKQRQKKLNHLRAHSKDYEQKYLQD